MGRLVLPWDRLCPGEGDPRPGGSRARDVRVVSHQREGDGREYDQRHEPIGAPSLIGTTRLAARRFFVAYRPLVRGVRSGGRAAATSLHRSTATSQ